jgi:signal transduction histidine kinase/ActR/RegA family two-component response regulator
VRKWTWAIVLACLLAVGGAAGWYFRAPNFGDRTYRIGWFESPPFAVRGPDGEPTGIAIELVSQAASRRGIHLQWVLSTQSSQSALVSKSVDLWPLITITPARLKVLHISEPYVQHEHCLLVRDDSPYHKVEQLGTAKIGMANVSIDSVNLRKVLPSASALPRTEIEGIVKDVCLGTSDAAFMDRATAIVALLRQIGCSHKLRWIPLPQVRSNLGVGSTFEFQAVADAIRQEIGVLADEGKLARVFDQWGYNTGQDLASVESLINVKRREIRLIWITAVFALLLLLACWQTLRLIRERDRTRQTEDALRQSQERYMQAQKLEGIGRLAGGVAHDFNNLLTIINGYSDLIYQQLPEQDSRRSQVNEIRKAGGRAAELTQQLLAFGRKQVGRPRPLNLNSVVEESEKMLRRLLCEDVRLVTRLDPALGLVTADPGHVHQVLMNLAVNARDAMPNGGTLFIETANERFDTRQVPAPSEFKSGPVVRLSVSDTGTGMDEETRKNIFEPFYTTKGNKGSGLGLATVYGIVQQNRGWIDVTSDLGKGSIFQIYLPRIEATDEPPPAAPPVAVEPRGSETVLVVEDQEEVLTFLVKALASHGYRVLQAADANQALTLAHDHAGGIDVLLTDVVLPGMNGKELADRFRIGRPGTKVIYTSGYTQDLIAHRGVLPDDISYIPKPYTADQIAAKVRETLGRNDRGWDLS